MNYDDQLMLADYDNYMDYRGGGIGDYGMGGFLSKLNSLRKKIHKKITPKPLLKLERKILNNPKIIKVVSVAGSIVAGIYGGPAAAQAVMAAGKMQLQKIGMEKEVKRAEAINKAIDLAQEKINRLPPEEQQKVVDAFNKDGPSALEKPEIKSILEAPIKEAARSLSISVETDKGVPVNVATANADKIAEAAPQIMAENKIFGIDKNLFIYGGAAVLGVVILSVFMRGNR